MAIRSGSNPKLTGHPVNITATFYLVVITSTSLTLGFSSNNDGDQKVFMVVDSETTFHDAGMGIMSKANPVQIGKFLLEDGTGLVAMVCLTEDVRSIRIALMLANLAPYSANVAGPIDAAELPWAVIVLIRSV
ncbi:hypothetical protein Tco_1557403, partial [Tanacetum coccineum]